MPTSPEEIFKRPSLEDCCYLTLSSKITHRSRPELHGTAAALSPQARKGSAAPVWVCRGNAMPDHCTGGFGPRPQRPGLRVENRQLPRRPSRPRSRTSCFSSQGQRTIKGAGEQLTGSKRGRQSHRLVLPCVSRTGRPPQPPAHCTGRLRATRTASTAPAAAEPQASRARPSRAPMPRAPAPARGRLGSAAASSLSRSPPGRPGATLSAAPSPWAAAGRLTARVAAASPAILCRVWCLSRLLARLYSLLLLPPTHPTHHTTWPLRCGGGCGGGRSSAAFQLAPLPQPPACSSGTPNAHARRHPPAVAIG